MTERSVLNLDAQATDFMVRCAQECAEAGGTELLDVVADRQALIAVAHGVYLLLQSAEFIWEREEVRFTRFLDRTAREVAETYGCSNARLVERGILHMTTVFLNSIDARVLAERLGKDVPR
jgi:hypothetical protein